MPTPTIDTDTDQDAGLVEGFDGVEDQTGSGHTSGPWSGDEIQELEQLAVIEDEAE